MQKRHQDKKQYFSEQAQTTARYVIPYIEQVKKVEAESRILEVGCGEGGNLIPFIERGCEVVGVDINQNKVEIGGKLLKDKYPDGAIQLMVKNIFEVSADELGQFDIIFLRDVIEHLPDQEVFLGKLKAFLKEDGVVFFGFPPWRMPFGGHQQICKSKVLSKLPYFHLLPNSIYAGILKMFGEKEGKVKGLLNIKSTGISTRRFEKIVKRQEYDFLRKTFYLINPNYKTKFGLKPRVQIKFIQKLPYFRDFFTTCMYAVIRKK